MKLSVHSILRYLERNSKIDIGLERHKCAHRLGYLKNNVKLTDTVFFKYLCRHFPNEIAVAKDDLEYYCGRKDSSFTFDGLKFIVRDQTLITVIAYD